MKILRCIFDNYGIYDEKRNKLIKTVKGQDELNKYLNENKNNEEIKKLIKELEKTK